MKECPVCKKKSIPYFKGFLVGPMIPIRCKNCNSDVYMDIKKYYTAASPFVMSFLFVHFIQKTMDPTSKFLIVMIGLFVSIILNIKMVSLKSSQEANTVENKRRKKKK